MSDYLWDKTGEPDADVERLERLLARFRHRPAPRAARPRRWVLALAAALPLVAALLLWRAPGTRGPTYEVTGVAGLERVGVGDWIEVGEERASVRIADIGGVDLEPRSRVRVDEIRLAHGGRREEHRLYLARGGLRASIFAAERVFGTSTPAGFSVDLGCIYTVEVDEHGTTRIAVETGRVAFGFGGAGEPRREVFVPSGASITCRKDGRPTPPIKDGAADAFVALIGRIHGGSATPADLEAALAAEERDDWLPLFELMNDLAIDRDVRGRIFDRFPAGFERPSTVTREGILAADPGQRQLWLDAIKHWWW